MHAPYSALQLKFSTICSHKILKILKGHHKNAHMFGSDAASRRVLAPTRTFVTDARIGYHSSPSARSN